MMPFRIFNCFVLAVLPDAAAAAAGGEIWFVCLFVAVFVLICCFLNHIRQLEKFLFIYLFIYLFILIFFVGWNKWME
jgi:hypothetical protein